MEIGASSVEREEEGGRIILFGGAQLCAGPAITSGKRLERTRGVVKESKHRGIKSLRGPLRKYQSVSFYMK